MHRKDIRMATALGIALFAAAAPAVAAAQAPTTPAVVRDARELACGPNASLVMPAAPIRIVGGEEDRRTLFAPGDKVIVNAGTSQGLTVGAEYFVRRVVGDRFAVRVDDTVQPVSIRTAGWLKLVDVRTDTSVATITHACDSISEGDYLEPLVVAPALTPAAAGEPDFANPGHLLMGDERRQMGGVGELMVLDRGSDHGMRAGQRLTIFRTTPGGPIVRVGEATTVKVSPETPMIRIDQVRDAVYVGDKVAIHR